MGLASSLRTVFVPIFVEGFVSTTNVSATGRTISAADPDGEEAAEPASARAVIATTPTQAVVRCRAWNDRRMPVEIGASPFSVSCRRRAEVRAERPSLAHGSRLGSKPKD
jgi:hypothetical protein